MGFSVGGLVGTVLGAGIGGMTGNPAIGASLGGTIGSMFGPSDQRLANRDRVQSMRDNLYMWDLYNFYNTPLQQRKRLEEAGMNPMMMYDKGSVENTSSMPSAPSSSLYSRPVASKAVARFFLNKDMQNAEDQSRANILNEEYLSLRNDFMKARIENMLTLGSKGANATLKERGIKDLIDEARLQKLLDEIDYNKNHPFSGKSTWGRLANDSYDLSSHYFDAVSGLMNSYMRYIEDKSSKFLKWYDRPSGRKISAELY